MPQFCSLLSTPQKVFKLQHLHLIESIEPIAAMQYGSLQQPIYEMAVILPRSPVHSKDALID
jgi:hypothetical protein